MTSVSQDSEVHITYEDQQQINTFARHNAKLQDIKEELVNRKKSLQNLEDACDELLMADDDTAVIPFEIGEVFISSTMDETTAMLEKTKVQQQSEIDRLLANEATNKQILSDLKVKLYAKFGNSINLEAEEE